MAVHRGEDGVGGVQGVLELAGVDLDELVLPVNLVVNVPDHVNPYVVDLQLLKPPG